MNVVPKFISPFHVFLFLQGKGADLTRLMGTIQVVTHEGRDLGDHNDAYKSLYVNRQYVRQLGDVEIIKHQKLEEVAAQMLIFCWFVLLLCLFCWSLSFYCLNDLNDR